MKLRTPLVLAAAGSALVLLSSASAIAGEDTGLGIATGGKNEESISAGVSVSYKSSGGKGRESGPITASGSWTPPACWYAPRWTAGEFKKFREGVYNAAVHDPGLPNDVRGEISDENSDYREDDNYNLEKEKDGLWWDAYQNPDAPLAEQAECDEDPFWVTNGETPDVPNAITPETLAGLAYNQVKVPGTKVTLAPADATKVNLPTWAWLDKGEFQPVSVTASFDAPGFHIEATTTATPVALTIKPGTENAQLHPSSGACPINEDGSIGTPYTKGASAELPPCGVTYLRSSGEGTFKLRATATWKITWKGTGGVGGDLPDGVYGNDQDITVEEIQSVNR
ncbi:hypothetical protein [Streptomyces coeruleorubidus]|uniref:hypothetical protein n=1 Tax=Streptomyces coeruleorubidus TaxID=116188 RepID=UPI0033C0352F